MSVVILERIISEPVALFLKAICAPTQRLVVVNLNKQNSNDLHTGVSEFNCITVSLAPDSSEVALEGLILLTSSPILGITGRYWDWGQRTRES
jgi:hypothetical protein